MSRVEPDRRDCLMLLAIAVLVLAVAVVLSAPPLVAGLFVVAVVILTAVELAHGRR